MKQPVPTVTHADVKRIVQRDFPVDQQQEVLDLLAEYSSGSTAGSYRVRLAVLKLSAGSFDALDHLIEQAKVDYRDVLSEAEYPAYSRQVLSTSLMESEGIESIIAEDWKQYRSWLVH